MFDAAVIAIPLCDLFQQRQQVGVIGEAHRLARPMAVECNKDRRMAKSFGHAACIKVTDGIGRKPKVRM